MNTEMRTKRVHGELMLRGRRAMLVHLPQRLAEKLELYAVRHNADVSEVVEQALTRALRAQRM